MASSQTPADDYLRQQELQEKQSQLQYLQKITPNKKKLSSSFLKDLDQSQICYFIHDVEIDGVTKFSPKHLKKTTYVYRNKCIKLADIQIIMRRLTQEYIQKGFITTRIYIPEQDIKQTKKLKLIVVEGKLSSIYKNGKPPLQYPNDINFAFPFLRGKVLNMRDIEQGLDQINRLASNNAKSDILPGSEDGGSIVNIINTKKKTWRIRLSHDTKGQASTGFARYTAVLSLDDVLKINDLWIFSYQRSNRDYWRGSALKGSSDSYSLSTSIPYGYWTFNLSAYRYNYITHIPGNFSILETSGNSGEIQAGASRVIHRNGQSITSLNFNLSYKQTNNFLMGNKIEVGSRRYSVGNISLSRSQRLLNGIWALDLSYIQGLAIFDAVRKNAPNAGTADPQFTKFVLTLNVNTPFKLGKQNFDLNNLIVAQYALQNLFASEQISLGGFSNVRGARDSFIFGNNGFFSRNEIVWRLNPWQNKTYILGELQPFVGIDYGQVFAQHRFNLTNEDLASWTLGVRLSGGIISFEFGYSKVFSTTIQKDRRGLAIFALTTSF